MLIKYVSYSQEKKAAQKKGIQCHFHNYKKIPFRIFGMKEEWL